MKKFSFRLQKILELKRLLEGAEKRKLGEQIKVLNKLQDHLQESENLKKSFDLRYHDVERKGKLDAIRFRRFIGYQNVLGNDIKKIGGQIDEHMIKVNEARDEVKKARCQTEIFKKIREKHYTRYLSDVNKEMEREMTEVAILRATRNQGEKGSALNVLLAIGASAFLMFLLFIGVLFAMGYLTPRKGIIISNLLAYKDDHRIIIGDKDPYWLNIADYKRLKEIESHYNLLRKQMQDDPNVVTKKVLDERKDILNRILVSVERTKSSFQADMQKIKDKETDLASREKALEKSKNELLAEVKSKKDKTFDEAQDENLKAMKIMDPGAIVQLLTNGEDFDKMQVNNPGDLQSRVAYAAKYIAKMKPRLRAGVLEEMPPKWSSSVISYIESNYPL